MDSELFTIGGRLDATLHSDEYKSKEASTNNLNYQWVRTLQIYRSLGKVLHWFLVLALIFMIVAMWPGMALIYKQLSKDSFSQKEGLQYLGASTNVTRDDVGWPTSDSLAEAALRSQTSFTEMQSAPKATFVVPREHMSPSKVETPEEKLLKQQGRQ